MTIRRISSNCCCNIIRYLSTKSRKIYGKSTIASTSIEVPTYCHLIVNLPCNITVNHLDLHMYDSNKIIYSIEENKGIRISHSQDGDYVYLQAEGQKNNAVTCEIEAPIKANLNIVSTGGNIDVGHFDSEQIQLTTTEGDVVVDKYVGKSVIVNTETGHVKFNDVIQAETITVGISESGSISTGRLQGAKLNLNTREGDISVESSYCDKSEFTVDEGNLSLLNTHKDCKVNVRESGSIKMTGFDGKLQAYIKEGPVDIQLSQVLDDSSLHIEKGGRLTMWLSEECQGSTSFEISAKKLHVEESVGLIKSLAKNRAYLTSLNELCKNFVVLCSNCDVEVKTASWADMLFGDKGNKKG